MQRKHLIRGLQAIMARTPAFSAHEHHSSTAAADPSFDLDLCIGNSYCCWCTAVGFPERKPEKRQAFYDSARFNSYWHWMWEGIKQVHGLTGEFSVKRWPAVSATIHKHHQKNPNLHVDALRKAGYERLIQDAYWRPGDDAGHPEIFSPTFRIDAFMYGYHPDVVGPGGFKTREFYGIQPRSFDDYMDFMVAEIERRHKAGAVALKCAEAYNRPLDFDAQDAAAARRAWNKSKEKVARQDWLAFGNFVFARCAETAARLNLPFQVHQGLGQLHGTNPMRFLATIQQHPRTRFVLFHYGYPWLDEVHGIVHNCRNALPDLTWLPLISTAAAKRALDECIEIAGDIRTIGWGSDCWTAEESAGALLAWRHVIGEVLADKVASGYLTVRDAEKLCVMLVRDNGHFIYNLPA